MLGRGGLRQPPHRFIFTLASGSYPPNPTLAEHIDFREHQALACSVAVFAYLISAGRLRD